MKNSILILLALTVNSISTAQNWSPIQVGEKINYSIDNLTLHSTIWVDSFQVQNSDTILFLNKTLIKCDQCRDSTDPWWISGFFLNNRTSFLPSKIRLKQNSTYELFEDNIRLRIKPNANLNETWLYDSLNNINAQVVNVAESAIFNTVDSIKIIELSNSDTVIISKKFGILKFPVDSSFHVTLFGIEERGLGYSTPYFTDFLDFAIGDKFEYKYTSGARFKGPTSNVKYTITNKLISADTLKYQIQVKKRKIFYDFDVAYDTVYSSYTDTLIYINNPGHFLNKNINQILNNNDKCGNKYKPVLLGFDSTFQTKTKFYPYNSYLLLSNDTVYRTHNPNQCYWSEIAVYGEGIGLISKSTSNSSTFYVEYSNKNLIACNISGIQFGIFTPDSNFVSGINRSSLVGKVELFPNPAFGKINVSITENKNACYTLILVSPLGEVIKKQNICGRINFLNIEDMQKGLYILKIFDDHGSYMAKKIIKL